MAAWPLGRLPGHRHAAKMAAVHRDAAFQWLGRPKGVPLEVGGPPAGDFIGRWAGQDTRDTQDTQDCGRVGLRAWLLACAKPLGQRASRPLHGLPVARERNAQDARCPSGPVAGAKRQAGAILGVVGVLGVLAKALEREAAKCLPGQRPQGVPLEVGGPPARISLGGGRTKTPGTPKTPRAVAGRQDGGVPSQGRGDSHSTTTGPKSPLAWFCLSNGRWKRS